MAELQGGLQRTAAEGGTLHATGVVARPAEQIAFEPVAGGTSDSGVPPSPQLHHAHTLQQKDASRKCRAAPFLYCVRVSSGGVTTALLSVAARPSALDSAACPKVPSRREFARELPALPCGPILIHMRRPRLRRPLTILKK